MREIGNQRNHLWLGWRLLHLILHSEISLEHRYWVRVAQKETQNQWWKWIDLRHLPPLHWFHCLRSFIRSFSQVWKIMNSVLSRRKSLLATQPSRSNLSKLSNSEANSQTSVGNNYLNPPITQREIDSKHPSMDRPIKSSVNISISPKAREAWGIHMDLWKAWNLWRESQMTKDIWNQW